MNGTQKGMAEELKRLLHGANYGDKAATKKLDAIFEILNEVEKTPSVFEEAESIIYGDREKLYGDPSKNLNRIAELWNSFLQERFREAMYRILVREFGIEVDDNRLRRLTLSLDLALGVTHVCRMMQLLKFARDENSPKRDNIVDDMGYAGLVHRCRTPNPEVVNGPVASVNSQGVQRNFSTLEEDLGEHRSKVVKPRSTKRKPARRRK